ncbi:MAG: proton-conducting transporter membrane subunit, partial [candidate division KSB1 bacterium]|nr:proton-conducting transporter membrane subunit [candidate division KSB1 bacterium]
MTTFIIGAVLNFISGFWTYLLPKRLKGIAGFIFLLGGSLLVLFSSVHVLLNGSELSAGYQWSELIGPVFFRIDSVAALFLVLITLGGLAASFYSISYMEMYQNEERASLSGYYALLGILISAMQAVVVVQNGLVFLVVWEIMSLASFFLVNFEHWNSQVRSAAVYYLVAMQVGAALLLTAFAWSYALTGSWDFAGFKTISDSRAQVLFLLFFIGFAFKAGFVPFHTWLPSAHPAAPSGVSALMSGVMIKTGIYGILRTYLIFGVPSKSTAFFVILISLISGLYGVLHATAQHDLKKLLAFHSIENIGIIGLGIGFGMLGQATGLQTAAAACFLGALLHTFNHFTFKSLLFFAAGSVYTKTHTRNIEQMGGLIHRMPLTGILFLIGALAISGLPLFSGFISEFSIYFGMINHFSNAAVAQIVLSIAGIAGLALIGAIAALCFSKAFGITFLGISRNPAHEPVDEAVGSMKIPMLFLAAIIVFIGLAAPLALPVFKYPLGQMTPLSTDVWQNLLETFGILSRGLLLFALFILIIAALRSLLLKGKIARYKTWDCGWQGT